MQVRLSREPFPPYASGRRVHRLASARSCAYMHQGAVTHKSIMKRGKAGGNKSIATSDQVLTLYQKWMDIVNAEIKTDASGVILITKEKVLQGLKLGPRIHIFGNNAIRGAYRGMFQVHKSGTGVQQRATAASCLWIICTCEMSDDERRKSHR